MKMTSSKYLVPHELLGPSLGESLSAVRQNTPTTQACIESCQGLPARGLRYRMEGRVHSKWLDSGLAFLQAIPVSRSRRVSE